MKSSPVSMPGLMGGVVLLACAASATAAPTTRDASQTDQNQQARSTSITDHAAMQSNTDVTPAISVEDQVVRHREALFKNVALPKAGWLVVHPAQSDGQMDAGQVVGRRHLSAGKHDNVIVRLKHKAPTGQTLYAVLHADTGHKGRYEYSAKNPDVDAPFQHDGQDVRAHFMVQMPADEQLEHTPRSTRHSDDGSNGSDSKSSGQSGDNSQSSDSSQDKNQSGS